MTPEIKNLQAQIDALAQLINKNNFSASQDFPKYSRFKTRLQVPTLAANPTIGAIGDIVCVGGKLKVCTTASQTAAVYTTVGTQT